MRNTVLFLIGVVFIAFLVGLFFTTSGEGSVPYVEQVSDPEASTLQVTSSQGATLAILVLLVVGSVIGMGATIYAVMWFLNREVTHIQQQPNQPMTLLGSGLSSDGGSSITAYLADNAVFLVVVAGGIMTAITIAVLLLTS